MAGIYIHIPFCRQACFYCNFHFSTSLKYKNDLVEAIMKEIDLRKEHWQNYVFDTVYFGGGTPSILPVQDIEKILNKLIQTFNIQTKEITIEANPDDLSNTKIKHYKNLGINRLSIGVQSFFDEDLKALNRSHNGLQAEKAIKNSQDIGIDNITIDLIYGIPGLTNDKLISNIQNVLDFKIPHVSAYALTIEQKTVLEYKIKNNQFPKVSDEQSAEQFTILRQRLIDNNFLHYEISNFGKQNYLSEHNTSYWKNTPYLGLGPSAHSYNGKIRSWNISNNAIYIKRINDEKNYFEYENLTLTDIYNELIMTGLRTMWGIDLSQIERLGNQYFDYLQKKSKKYISENKLFIKDHHLIAKPDYLFLIEGIISDLFYV